MKAHETNSGRPMMNVDQWVDEHADLLFHYALQRVRRRDLAEDLVQETFVAALRSQGTFDGQSTERTWLVGILRHKIIDHIRRNSRSHPDGQVHEVEAAAASQFEPNGRWRNPVSDWGADPSVLAENHDFWLVFHKCFGVLPEPLAQVFALREMDDLASADVCKTLNITDSNLWVRLHRARLLLKDCLENNWFQREDER